jgi:regulatory protein
MEKKDDLASARNAADRFLKFRPRSVKEIREKLASKDYTRSVTDTVVAELLENGLLNDEEFARAWAESRVLSKKLGTRKVLNELAQKGVSRDILAKTEEYLNSKYDESANARELLDRKFRGNAANTDKKKLVGFLVRNGYTFSQADKTVKEVLRKKNDDDD